VRKCQAFSTSTQDFLSIYSGKEYHTPAEEKIVELRTEELKICYIMLLTGNLGTENLVEALGKDADDFIINKPCNFQELIARIRVGFRILNLQNDLRMAN
jgi:DNA-binding response OmpR family regulator